jgi:hypothetical protein
VSSCPPHTFSHLEGSLYECTGCGRPFNLDRYHGFRSLSLTAGRYKARCGCGFVTDGYPAPSGAYHDLDRHRAEVAS